DPGADQGRSAKHVDRLAPELDALLAGAPAGIEVRLPAAEEDEGQGQGDPRDYQRLHPSEPAPEQHRDPDHEREESAARMGQGQGMTEEGQRGQPEYARATAPPIEQAVEREDHRAVDDLADVVGVAEIPGGAEPPDPEGDLPSQDDHPVLVDFEC